jgi:enoyl-CoA hydratase/carnithine racemase
MREIFKDIKANRAFYVFGVKRITVMPLLWSFAHQKNVFFCRFGIFPSWGLSQRLQRAIGPYRAREVSLTAAPLDAQTAEKWGLVSRVVPPSELLGTARGIAEAILKNQEGLVLKYKAVINDGFKLPLGEALKLEQVIILYLF